MATADLLPIDVCCFSLSPLMDRRKACMKVMGISVRSDLRHTIQARGGLASLMFADCSCDRVLEYGERKDPRMRGARESEWTLESMAVNREGRSDREKAARFSASAARTPLTPGRRRRRRRRLIGRCRHEVGTRS